MRNTNFKEMEQYFRDTWSYDYSDECGGTFDSKSSIQDMCIWLLEHYRKNYNYPKNLHDFPNEKDRLGDFMKGLPAPFYPEIGYWEIEEQLRDWGIIKKNDSNSKVQKMKDGYHPYWGNWILQNVKGGRL